MKLSINSGNDYPEDLRTPPHLHLEPQVSMESDTLERLLKEFPSAVQGFGRNAKTGKIVHLQLKLEKEPTK